MVAALLRIFSQFSLLTDTFDFYLPGLTHTISLFRPNCAPFARVSVMFTPGLALKACASFLADKRGSFAPHFLLVGLAVFSVSIKDASPQLRLTWF